jgi:hypothetical protein
MTGEIQTSVLPWGPQTRSVPQCAIWAPAGWKGTPSHNHQPGCGQWTYYRLPRRRFIAIHLLRIHVYVCVNSRGFCPSALCHNQPLPVTFRHSLLSRPCTHVGDKGIPSKCRRQRHPEARLYRGNQRAAECRQKDGGQFKKSAESKLQLCARIGFQHDELTPLRLQNSIE